MGDREDALSSDESAGEDEGAAGIIHQSAFNGASRATKDTAVPSDICNNLGSPMWNIKIRTQNTWDIYERIYGSI